MLPLFDMLANARNGNGIDLLARQFGLSRQQAQLAMEALLPAFSEGLKRNASDPYGVGSFINAMATGQHAQYFDDPGNAFAPQGVAEGNGILGHLFGSKELSRAVAAQAEQATGISREVLKQMLPVMASMIMGGLFKQSTGQMAAASRGGGNVIGDIIEQMMRQGTGTGGAPPAPGGAGNPFDNPFGKVLEGMFGAGAPAPGAPAAPAGENPLGRIFEELLGGGQAQHREPSAGKPRANPSGRPRNPYDDLFGDMFETGRKTRDDYQKNMESIFDRFVKGMDRSG